MFSLHPETNVLELNKKSSSLVLTANNIHNYETA